MCSNMAIKHMPSPSECLLDAKYQLQLLHLHHGFHYTINKI